MENITFMGLFVPFKDKLGRKSSLTINSCLLLEFTLFIRSFSGKLDVRDWKSTGLFRCIRPLLLQKGWSCPYFISHLPSLFPNKSRRVCLARAQILTIVTNERLQEEY